MCDIILQSKLIIRSIETFEQDYKFICSQLQITPLSINDNVQSKKHISKQELLDYDEAEHREDNEYDWMLYDVSVRKKGLPTHP